MSKSNFMRIVLLVGSALILIGVALITWMLLSKDDSSVIEVQLEDGKTQSVEFGSLRLVPGEECEYTITLKSEYAKKYNLKLDFVETEEKSLKDFARVRIALNGETVCDELLATAFENENISIPVDFSDEKNAELKIVYYLPIDVGNEAKNAEAVFDLLLTVNNE